MWKRQRKSSPWILAITMFYFISTSLVSEGKLSKLSVISSVSNKLWQTWTRLTRTTTTYELTEKKRKSQNLKFLTLLNLEFKTEVFLINLIVKHSLILTHVIATV